MIRIPILIILLIQQSSPQCAEGCLKCTSAGICLFCDPNNGFFINGQTCAKTTKIGCKKVDVSGNCLTCFETNSYVDPTTKNCVQLSANTTIANCQQYSAPNACTACQAGFYPANITACLPVSPVLTNCLVQDTNITCTQCASGFGLSSNRTICNSLGPIANCQLYSQTVCSKCKSGFNKSPYLSLSILQNTTFLQSFASSLFLQFSSVQLTGLSLPACYAIQNCALYSRSDFSCTQCLSGYYFSTGVGYCVLNPLPKVIPFCNIYQTAGTCAKCMTGYLLASSTSCVLNGAMPGCQIFDFSAKVTTCLNCTIAYYMNAGAGCKLRTFGSIINCATYDPFNDRCAICTPNNVLTSDQLNCLNWVANCATYQPSSYITTNLICTSCLNAFYLVSLTNTCRLGTIANCQAFQTSANICTLCLTGFYLVGVNCVPVTPIQGCILPSTTLAQQCTQCALPSVKYTVMGTCVAIAPVPNCLAYSSQSACSSCPNGYSLTSNACVLVIFANCAVFYQAGCVTCSAGYIFNSASTACVAAAAQDQANCVNNVMWGTNQGDTQTGCKTCSTNSGPLDYQNAMACLPLTLLTATNGAVLDSNCLFSSYSATSSTYVCISCAPGYYVLSGACAAGCTTSPNNLIYSFTISSMITAGKYDTAMIIQKNSCGPSAVPIISNCARAAPTIIQSSTTSAYGCISCATGYLPFVTTSTVSLLRATLSTSIPTISSVTPQSRVPAVNSCLTSQTILGSTVNAGVLPNCAYYYTIPGFSQNSCLQCTWGNTGVVLLPIAYCFRYTETSTCQQCLLGYYLNTPASNPCIPIVSMTNCLLYDNAATTTSCLECSISVSYLPAEFPGTCTTRTYTDAACLTFSSTADVCFVCDSLSTAPNLILGKCYASITNCLNYATLVASPFYECAACDSTNSFIQVVSEQNVCTLASITGCTLYSQTVTTAYCMQCLSSGSTPTLSNGLCYAAEASGTMGFCAATTSDTLCATCYFDALLFSVVSTCQTPSIENCLTYSSYTNCQTCAIGYYLLTPISCQLIPASVNCAIYVPLDLVADGVFTTADYLTGNVFAYTCWKCSANYYLTNITTSVTYIAGGVNTISTATCSATTFPAIPNCRSMNTDGTGFLNNIDCNSGCASGYNPYAWDGLNLCVANSYFTTDNTVSDANCHYYQFDVTSSHYKCKKCNYPYGLTSAGACVTSCGANSFIALYTYSISSSPFKFKVSQRNVCVDLTAQTEPTVDASCLFVVPQYSLSAVTSAFRYVCVRCPSTLLPIVSLDITATNSLSTPVLFSPFNVGATGTPVLTSTTSPWTEALKCLDYTLVTFLGGTVVNTLIPNCDKYSLIETSNYGCVRCQLGYTGVIALSVSLGYITACTEDSTCSITSSYAGTQQNAGMLASWPALNTLFSCFACATANQIPTVFVSIQASPVKVLGYMPYSYTGGSTPSSTPVTLNSYFTQDTPNPAQNNIKCIGGQGSSNIGEDSNNNVYFTTAQIAFGYIANCGLVIANVNADTTATTVDSVATAGAYCVACAPGFTPSYSFFTTGAVVTTYISGCTAILNCPTAKGFSFNICDTCSFGSTVSTNFLTVDYTTCVSTTLITNCFIATSGTVCKLCLPGYTLSATAGSCSLLTDTTPCTSYQLADPFPAIMSSTAGANYILTNNDALLPFYSMNHFGGCSACASSMNLVVANHQLDNQFSTEFCLKSTPAVILTNVLPYSVANCETFGWIQSTTANTVVACIACSSGFVITNQASTSANICVANTGTAANCVLYNFANSKCLTCISTSFLNVGGTCSAITGLTASNCYTFDFVNSRTAVTAQCLSCNYGFTLTAGACSTITGTIDNCGVATGTTCTQCMPGYVLRTSSTSVLSCMLVSASGQTAHDSNCLVLSSTSFASYNLVCSVCSATFFPNAISSGITTWCYQYPFTSPATCSSFYVTQPAFNAISSTCIHCQDETQTYLSLGVCTTRVVVVPNCFMKVETQDACSYCAAGFTLAANACTAVVVQTNVPLPTVTVQPYKYFLDNTGGYLDTCATAITDCARSTYYNGLDAPLSVFFSCHACETSPNIPFVFLNAGNGTYSGITTLFSYSLTNSTEATPGWYDGGLALRCLNPVSTSFHSALTNKFNFPANCALGIMNVLSALDARASASSTEVDKTQMAVFCGACKPMYSPSTALDATSTLVPTMVSACTIIAHCQASITFNKCDACATGYAFLYATATDIDFTNCASTSDTNCLVVSVVSSLNVCKICRLGYYINLDGTCETFQAPNCSGGNGQYEKNLIGVNIITALIWQPYKGCTTSCASGFIPAQNFVSKLYCQVGSNLNPPPSTSLYTANCLNYQNAFSSGNVLCNTCKSSFLITTVNTCIIATDTNCLIAVSATVCNTCVSSSYLIINGVCTLKNILNCITYSTTITTSLVCTVCLDTYYLLGNACVFGTLSFCAAYTNPLICNRCVANYALRTKFNFVTECIAINPILNCQTFNSISFNSFQVVCSQCQTGFFTSSFSSSARYDFCMGLPVISDCVAYDLESTYKLTTGRCMQCSPTTYLTATATCTARTSASLTNCTLADPKSDTCLSATPATSGTITYNPASVLSPQPLGIVNCLGYDSNLNCIQCNNNMYYNKTHCLSVPTVSLISNCLVYNIAQICTQCSVGYLLKNKFCVPILGVNCQTVDFKSTGCLSCVPGYGLYMISGINTCVVLNATNCLTYAQIYPYNCSSCTAGYGFNSSICSLLNTTISNCAIHLADGVCQFCSSGFALFVNQTSNATSCLAIGSVTVSYTDPNCDNWNYSPSGICMICGAGYVLQAGVCVANSLVNRCLVNDYSNPNGCLVCQSGFFMNSTYFCN